MASSYGSSPYSASASAGAVAGGVNADGLFSQVDTNKDGTIDYNEFSNPSGSSLVVRQASVGGAAAGYGSSSYETTSDSATGGAFGVGASTFESSPGDALVASTTSQAANYTAETNPAWSRYGADVRGPGLFMDPNPQIIRRQVSCGVQSYTQSIKIRFLQPPPVPPPGVS